MFDEGRERWSSHQAFLYQEGDFMGHTCRSMGPHTNADMRPFHSLVGGKGPQGPFPFSVASRSPSKAGSDEQVCGAYPESFDNDGPDGSRHV